VHLSSVAATGVNRSSAIDLSVGVACSRDSCVQYASTPVFAVCKVKSASLKPVYRLLYATHGPQHWWPGDTHFEIMVGAILTQNTAWSNVEKAIANLVARDQLDAGKILAARRDHLANWLRPSGYFNIKAGRLKNFCRWYLDAGGYPVLARNTTDELRNRLLSVNGIGPETADDILLYAFERPVFVIDAYTRRLFARLGLAGGHESYEVMRSAIETALGPDTALYNEFHALIVRHAKEVCRLQPRCEMCVLSDCCPGKAE
jgi:endonuclease-3 related protein